MSSLIIEDGFNTSYLDTLFMSLFYRVTHLDDILTNLSTNPHFSYLQELINSNFIEKVRKNHSIDSSIINEIRNYSFFCKWKEGYDVTALYSPIDYFDFLIKGIGFLGIKYEIIEISKNQKEDIVTTVSVNYINTTVEEDTDIKLLLKKWISKFSNNPNTELQCYHFTELPMLVPIYLNRSTKEGQIENFKVDIKEKIRFDNNNDKTQLDARWIIHSIICRSPNNSYYAILV